MKATQVEIGSPLEIHIKRDGKTYRLVSKVVRVEEDKIYVSLLATATKVFMFKATDDVLICYRENGRKWVWQHITGEVVERGGVLLHLLNAKGNAEALNRRNTYRVPVGILCEFFHTVFVTNKATGQPECIDRIPFKAIVKDISENGVAIIAKYPLQVYNQIDFDFPIDDHFVPCSAQVVREMQIDGIADRRVYGCLLSVSDSELSKYVADRQREHLQSIRKNK